MNTYDANELRKLQLAQLEMLKIVDEVCQKNGIQYSLYAGTLLGAVRHQGFIPWDDDLDICMSRNNYNRFIQVWDEEHIEGYLLQNKENSPHFSQSFTKIRKDHTTFLQNESEVGQYHTGIFIDVFPIDRIPNGTLSRYLFYWACMQYQLFTREFVPQQYGRINKVGSTILLALTPPAKRKQRRGKLLAKITSYNVNKNLETVAIETVSSIRKSFSPNLTEKYTTIVFEGREFMCFADWEDHLYRKFGNYMQLPPESERTWKHHPILIDFEHNYEELDYQNEP